MKGKKVFTRLEADEIIELIGQKLKSDTNTQKGIRNKIRKRGFYATDFGIGGGYTVNDFLSVVTIVGEPSPKSFNSNTSFESDTIRTSRKRTDSDEDYVIGLCDEVLGEHASRQHKFDFLRGDPGKDRRQGVCLPVDAYYSKLNLVIEYREKQHTESVNHFDKPDKMTVSGVHRGEQRKIYDQRRRDVLPQHGIRLLEISYEDFKYDNQKRIIRAYNTDIDKIKTLLT